MKKVISGILAALFCLHLSAQTADQDVTNGLNYLAAQDLVHANLQFTNALALSPTNDRANVLVAATRLLLLPTSTVGSNFLNSMGFSVSGRDVFDWTSQTPTNADGQHILPAMNTATIVSLYRTNVMAVLAASRTNLTTVSDPGFTLPLTASETTLEAVTVDYGDILMLRALEWAAEFAGYTANVQNGNVVLSQLQNMFNDGGLTIQSVLSQYPNLLTPANNPSDLAASKNALTNAVTLYFAASDFIRNTRPPGAAALFVLSDDQTNGEAVFRTELTNALAALNGPVTFNALEPHTGSVTINASNYFAGAENLRELAPQFNGVIYVHDSLPDYSLGGMLVAEPAYLTEQAARKLIPSYAGIYTGQVDDWNDNSSSSDGGFAIFSGTNQQATMVGYDSYEAYPLNALFAQFNVEIKGGWEIEGNAYYDSSGGSFHNDGSLDGEIDFTNNVSVWLTGNQQSAWGRFQNTAGYYTGTWSVGGKPGALTAVLSADGELYLCEFRTSGGSVDGGWGQFDSNNQVAITSVNGATLSGTLNTSTFTIAGNGTFSGGSGTFSLTRTANVPFDVPPVITQNLPSTVTVGLGNKLSLSLMATGSPPMCYQWYANGVAIPLATTNTLNIPILSPRAAGSYSVTINNVVGGTNASFTLNVGPDTNPPTIQITSPAAGQQVSNAVCTVTGNAGDNVAVSNVWVQVNSNSWQLATTTDQWSNWTAQVSLTANSNTVQAYAVDTSGNVSPTNSVTFKYVVSAPLTLQVAGVGTISPNDSNAWLQVGATYSLTAAPVAGAGFAFTNWTGGTSLPLTWLTNGTTVKFTMASNLVLQASFVDTNRPVFSITNETASGDSFVVSGTNKGVAEIFGRLNGSGSTAGTVNVNNRTWAWSTSQTNVLPGTNYLQIYAESASGIFSPTNSTNYFLAVPAALRVQTNGVAVLTPNYNGELLFLGRNYSITAAAGKGFKFTNWTGGTSLALGLITNGTAVQFMMQSNLVLAANLVETSRPTLTLSTPVNGQHLSNALPLVSGTAGDNWKVTGVWCQVNSNGWALAASTNGWTNWAAVLKLGAGTNRIYAYAADLGGNVSQTNISVVSSNAFKLWLSLTNILSGQGNGEVFSLTCSTGLWGHIEYSTNLLDWSILTNFAGTSGSVTFRDPSTNSIQRFYRAVIP